jgi:plasmid replication initiation protein
MTKNEIAKTEKTMFPDILKKSNFLISSVYRASLLENKVLALALTKVRLSDEGRPVATLKTREIKEMMNVTGNAMGTYLKDVATSLAGRTMFIESEDGSFKCMSLVGVVSYQSGSGTMEIKFEPEIKDYIYDLKANFTMLNIPMMLSFRSGWSYRLYELLVSRAYHSKYDKDNGNVFHIKYGVSELKLHLGTVQIKDDKGKINRDIQKELEKKDVDYDHIVNDLVHEKLKSFDKWCDFKRRVLDVAVDEINEKSDLHVEYELMRSGRGGKIYGIDFEVIKQDNTVEPTISEDVPAPSDSELDDMVDAVMDIIDEKIKISQAKALLKVADYNVTKIEVAYELACKQEEIHNLIGWMTSAIQNNYQDNPIHKVKGYSAEETIEFDEYMQEIRSENEKKLKKNA